MSALKRWQLPSADLFVCDGCCNYRAVARHRVVLPHHATSSRTDAFKNKSRPFKTWCIHCFSRSCPGGGWRWRRNRISATLPGQNGSWRDLCKCQIHLSFLYLCGVHSDEQQRPSSRSGPVRGDPPADGWMGKSSAALLSAILIQQHQRRVQSTWIKHCTMGDAEWETDRSFSFSVLQLSFSFSANVFVE